MYEADMLTRFKRGREGKWEGKKKKHNKEIQVRSVLVPSKEQGMHISMFQKYRNAEENHKINSLDEQNL